MRTTLTILELKCDVCGRVVDRLDDKLDNRFLLQDAHTCMRLEFCDECGAVFSEALNQALLKVKGGTDETNC